MIKYEVEKTPDNPKEYLEILKTRWINNWEWQQDKFWYMIFYKKVVTQVDKQAKIDNASPEWLEFIKEYRLINNKWSYDERLITKYHNVLKEYKHTDIMQNLSDYKKHLEAFNKPPLQVGTYLNQKRFLDKWEIIKVDFTKKWIDDVFKQRKIPQNIIDPVLTEIQRWEAMHKDKELTIWILDNMILKYKW